MVRGAHKFICNDNEPEFIAEKIKMTRKSTWRFLCLAMGNPCENGYIKSVKGKTRDAVMNREVFLFVEETKIIVKYHRLEYNYLRFIY